jgi:hypothetical protein
MPRLTVASRRPAALVAPVVVLAFVLRVLLPAAASARIVSQTATSFAVSHAVALEVPIQEAWDAFVGDVTPWWDHHFSEKPHAMYFEAKPGGGFYEIFDEAGNGVRHAVVTTVAPPALFRFEGPLGLAGHAIQMVHTVAFTADGDERTQLFLDIRASGALQESWAEAIDGVWIHFLMERFKPYVEGTLGSEEATEDAAASEETPEPEGES